LLATLFIVACAPSPQPEVAPAPQSPASEATSEPAAATAAVDAIESPAQAIALLDRGWAETIAPKLEGERPRVAERWWSTLASSDASRMAAAMPCTAGAQRIRDTLGPSEQESILYGTVDELARAGRCWEVTVSLGFDSLFVYFTATEGRLVLAWWPPEG
jgi:hypothetical protein